MDSKEDIKKNIWINSERFDEVCQFIKQATRDRLGGWQWINNSECKYIILCIDMRDGGFNIQSRDGKRITFEELKKQ